MKLSIILGLVLSTMAMAETPRFDNSRLFVKLEEGKALPKSTLIKRTKHLFGNNYIVFTQNADKLQKLLVSHDSVITTHKNYYAGKRVLPKATGIKKGQEIFNFAAFNDPKVGRVWSFNDSSRKGVSVNKSYLSPLGTQKDEIIVAVVDTGVDYNHEDLRSVMWKNTNEIEGNGIDDDNNGYIDDVYGINTLIRDENGNASGNPMASHAHGTHVAGTIAAAQNNQIGIAGIASNAKIMAIRG